MKHKKILRWGFGAAGVATAAAAYLLVAETPFTNNISLVGKSYAAAKIDRAIDWGNRALTTDPAELMDDIQDMGEAIEKVLKQYRGAIATGEFDGVLQSMRETLEEQRKTISDYRSSEANSNSAEHELHQCLIHVETLSELAHAVDRARDAVPKCSNAAQRYEKEKTPAAPEIMAKKGKPTTQQLAAEAHRLREQGSRLEQLAACAETIVDAYAAVDAVQQKLEHATHPYEANCLIQGLASYAPVLQRRELNTLLDRLTGQLRGFYDGESRAERDRDATYQALRTMNKDDISQARKIIDASVDGALRTRFFVDDVQALGRLPKQYRMEAVKYLVESVYASSPEEGEQLARMLMPKIAVPASTPVIAAAPPAIDAAHYDREDAPPQTYTPPIPEKGFVQRMIEKIL